MIVSCRGHSLEHVWWVNVGRKEGSEACLASSSVWSPVLCRRLSHHRPDQEMSEGCLRPELPLPVAGYLGVRAPDFTDEPTITPAPSPACLAPVQGHEREAGGPKAESSEPLPRVFHCGLTIWNGFQRHVWVPGWVPGSLHEHLEASCAALSHGTRTGPAALGAHQASVKGKAPPREAQGP